MFYEVAFCLASVFFLFFYVPQLMEICKKDTIKEVEDKYLKQQAEYGLILHLKAPKPYVF